MNLDHANKDLEQLVRIAETDDNSIALAIANYPVDDDDTEDQLEECISDIADHFISEIDEKIQAYIDDWYLNPESDEHDYLWELSESDWCLDSVRELFNADESTNREAKFSTVEERLCANLEYYCEVEITQNYAAPNGTSVNGYCLGEKEEQIDFIDDMMPQFNNTDTADRVREYILNGLTAVSVHDKSDCFYLDFSDTYANLVLKTEMIGELFAAE